MYRPLPSAGRPAAARGPDARPRGPEPPAARRPAPKPGTARAAPRPPAARRPPPPSRLRRDPPGSPRPRLRLVSLALTLVMLVFAVRLFQVQAVDADAYAGKAASNRYVTVPLAAERGAITARHGSPWPPPWTRTTSPPTPACFARGRPASSDAPQQAAALLAPILDGRTADDLAAKLANQTPAMSLLARQQTPQVWRQIKDLKGPRRQGGSVGRPPRSPPQRPGRDLRREAQQAGLPQQGPRRRRPGLRQRARAREAAAWRHGSQEPRGQGRQDHLRPVRAAARCPPPGPGAPRRPRHRRPADPPPRHPVGGPAGRSPTR